MTQIHNALVEINHNFEVEPVLARNYQLSDDGLAWTFNLHRGVKFHDGTEFTSRDVKYTFEWHKDPKNASAWANVFAGVDRVETPDKYTAVIPFKQRDARFLRFGATYHIVPAQYHSRVGEDKYKTAPVGTGPFKLKEWRPADFTLLEAFPDHFRGRPNDVPLNLIALNNQRPQLFDRPVRQAMMHAIDRERMVREVFLGQATVATANVSPTVKAYYEPNVKRYTHDPREAEKLLDEAGWRRGPDGVREKEGSKLEFTLYIISGDQVRKPQAEFVQAALRPVGIRMEIREAPWATNYTRMLAGEIDAALFNWTHGGWDGEPDATAALSCRGANNFHRFCRTRVDELLALGARELDTEKRRRIYSEIQGTRG